MRAIVKSNPAVIEALIKAKVVVNMSNNQCVTPFVFAIIYDFNLTVVEDLIKANTDFNTRNEDDITPLMVAASMNSNPFVVEALINTGTEMNARDESDLRAFDLLKIIRVLSGKDLLEFERFKI